MRPAVAVAAFVLLLAPPSGAFAAAAVPDLSAVVLAPTDLPPGFKSSADRAASFMTLAHSLAGSLTTSPDSVDVNATVLERSSGTGAEFVTAVLIAPISEGDRAAFDATAQRSGKLLLDAVGGTFTDATVTTIDGMRTGVSRFAVGISSPSIGLEYRAVAARRGPVIEVIGHAWTAGPPPSTSLDAIAGTLDARLAAAVGPEAAVFRPAGPLTPEITTHIPSPLDLSTDPAVVGTNLVLAALALLLLTISAKVATRLLAEHEGAIGRAIPLAALVARLEGRLAALGGGRTGGSRVREAAAFVGVTLFYGLTFSLLEPSWQPLSVTGLWLFASLTVANAIVGIGDDVVSWRVARHWGVAARLAVRPTSALTAVGSVGVSRFAGVVPGLMFGTPEALQVDGTVLDGRAAHRLAVVGTVVLVGTGAVAWAMTIATTGLARAGEQTILIGGLEALLLLIFASALQNVFVALLGFGGSVGELLRTRSRAVWIVALTVVTFLFFHALLNPQGDPATALANRNVQVTMGLVGGFSATTAVAWLVARLAASPVASGSPTAAPADVPAGLPITPPPASGVAMPPAALVVIRPPAPVSQAAATSLPGVVTWPPATAGPFGVASQATSLRTADGSARGRAWFEVHGDQVMARTELLDPRAVRQYRVLVVLTLLAWLAPLAVGGMVARDPRPAGDVLAIGRAALCAAWVVVVVGGRLWLERHRVVHLTRFALRDVAAVDVGRDWGIGCALTILLSPLIGLLYLLLAGGRVVRIVAPLAADRAGPVTVRLKGSREQGLALRRLLLGPLAAGD